MAAGDELRRIARRADTLGGRAAAATLASEGAKEIRGQLTKRSHPPGTPTPSPAGQPPARVSGRLANSVITVQPVPAGAHRWVSMAGPHGVVYARIQDQGGRAGVRHSATLPPRPYRVPAARALRAGPGPDRAASAFMRATFG